jgi:UDP-N-acetylmuramoyl-L-alanyl-D-glutamate--2,6-diaminopimelate ligase
MVMLQNTRAQVRTYALKHGADFKGKLLDNSLEGLSLEFDGIQFHSRLIGDFNASNLLAVYGTAMLLGIPQDKCLEALSAVGAVAGRFDYQVSASRIIGVVDYAHTPDALENVLATIRRFRKGSQRIISVVGCGGDRDKSKRPIMAKIACSLSDQVILSSDNPRTESPEAILDDMAAGITNDLQAKYLRISDRKEAIRTACLLAQAGDIILLAGKGHETYQEIMGVKHPFDDKAILAETFQLLKK